MNRRQLLVAALAAPILTMPMSALAATRRIVWEPGALGSPHALLVAQNLNQVIADRFIYSTGEMFSFGHKITLDDPRFVVRPSDIMWHGTRGYRYEPSLTIDIFETGFRLGQVDLYSTTDYADYYGAEFAAEHADRPDYGVRALHVPYERFSDSPTLVRNAAWEVVEKRPTKEYVLLPDIEAALGRDAIGIDDRWIKSWATKGMPA